MRHLPLTSLFTLALLLTASLSHAQMFRWVDESGKVHYSDTPPADARKGSSELSGGVVVKQNAADLTPAQLKQKEAADALAKVEMARLAEQKLHDKSLISTFSNTAEIDVKRDKQIEQVQGEIKILNSRIAQATERKNGITATKARILGAKRTPPASLDQDFAAANAEIAGLKVTITERQKQQALLRTQAEADKKRFIELTSNTANAQ